MSATITYEVLWDEADVRSIDDRVDSYLRDLVDDTVDYAAGRLREHAPGRIDEFVTSDGAQLDPQVGSIEGMAGVLPDPEESFVSARGSRRADFPYYVDVGTGLFGEFARPISAMPGGVMGPIEFRGRMLYPTSVAGQPGQDYSGAAHRDTDAWLPVKVRQSSPKL